MESELQESSHSCASDNENTVQPTGTRLEQFAKLRDQYFAIVQESAPEYIEERRKIEQTFQSQLQVIDNYCVNKRNIVLQEGCFFQQVHDDNMMSQNE